MLAMGQAGPEAFVGLWAGPGWAMKPVGFY